jgi:hypothetical protein
LYRYDEGMSTRLEMVVVAERAADGRRCFVILVGRYTLKCSVDT